VAEIPPRVAQLRLERLEVSELAVARPGRRVGALREDRLAAGSEVANTYHRPTAAPRVVGDRRARRTRYGYRREGADQGRIDGGSELDRAAAPEVDVALADPRHRGLATLDELHGAATCRRRLLVRLALTERARGKRQRDEERDDKREVRSAATLPTSCV